MKFFLIIGIIFGFQFNMKYFKLLFILSPFLFAFSDVKDKDIITWSTNRKLSWDNFQGKPKENSNYSANTHASFHRICKVKNDTVYCEILTEFRISKSWVKTEKKTEYLLNHEQRHFDIAEYISRCFRENMATYQVKSISTYPSEMDSLKLVYHERFNSIQERYDEETNHSKIKDKQLEWNDRIDSLLKSKENFSNTKINMYIGHLYNRQVTVTYPGSVSIRVVF